MAPEHDESDTVAAKLADGPRDALSDLLNEYNSRRSAVELTVVPVLSELALLLDGVASGRVPLFENDRTSLVSDLDLALTRAGARLNASTSPTMHQLRTKEVARLGQVFKDPAAAAGLASTVREVLDQLRTAELVAAAWDDMVAAVVDGAPTTSECALRVAQMVELVSGRGHDWTAMKESLTSAVLHSDLQQGREVAVSEPVDDVVAVWVGFGNAPLNGGYRRIGQVQFFGDELSMDELRDGAPALETAEFERPTELTDESIEWHFSRIEAQHYVLARVEFVGPRARRPVSGTGPPIAWGRQLAAGIVEAAGFRLGGTDWQLLDGGCYFLSDGSHAGSGGFGDPMRRKALENCRAPIYEPTAEALDNLPSSFADALASGDPAAIRAVTEVAWHRGATTADDAAMRLALRVRGFESQWAAGPGRTWDAWEEPVRHYFRDHWARDMILSRLLAAATTVQLPPPPIRSRVVAYPKGIEQVRAEIISSEDGPSFVWNPAAVLRVSSSVATCFVGGSLPRRQWKELARVSRSGREAQSWWRSFRAAFEVLLNRAVRQRNAVVHGRDLVPAVVASVEPFLARVSSYLVAEGIQAASEAYDLDQHLESARNRLANDYDMLAAAASGLALYPDG